MGPLLDLRKEYLSNPISKKEIDTAFSIPTINIPNYSNSLKTPKKNINDISFNSPLPLKSQAGLKLGSQIQQDTPLRRVKFSNMPPVIYECNLPANVDYDRDPIFAKIIHSEQLEHAVKCAKSTNKAQLLRISSPPIANDSYSTLAESDLTESTKHKLQFLGIKSNETLQSAVLNAPFYERLLTNLREKNVDYDQCEQLKPFELLGNELRINKPLYEEIREYVTSMPNSLDIAYTPINMGVQQALNFSKSTDSGFDSKPSTPSHTSTAQTYVPEEIRALSGRLTSVPGIQDMNMYPSVELSKQLNKLSLKQNEQLQNSQQLHYSSQQSKTLFIKTAIEF